MRLAPSVTVAGLLGLWGCGQDPSPAAPPPAKAARADETPPTDTPPAAPAAASTQRVEAGRVHADIPQSWSAAPPDQLTRLKAQALAGDDERTGKVAVYLPGADASAGGLQLLDVQISDPFAYWGWTPREAAEAYADVFRGTPTWSEVEVEALPRAMEVTASNAGARSRLRLWALNTGEMIQVSCSCRGDACEAFDSCQLQDAPLEAVAVDEAITDGHMAIALELADGRLRVDAPPGYQRLDPGPSDDPELVGSLMYRPSGPRSQEGFVGLEQTQCDLGPHCSLAALEAATKPYLDAVISRGERDGLAYLRLDYSEGIYHRRRVGWEGDGKLHLSSCNCTGAACPLAKRTCTLWPADGGTD